MHISEFMDLDFLQSIQDAFSEATGLAAIAVDNEGKYITKGSNFTDFCMKYTRQSEEGKRLCETCDKEGKGSYYCHAGLIDFANDIIVNDQKVGTIVGGQVLSEEPDLEKFAKIANKLGIDEKSYIDAVKKVPVRSEKSIHAAASLLSDVVNTMANLAFLQHKSKKRLEVFDKEITIASESIKEINELTKKLAGIASKQNILALNATIEAARAGDAGRGFAVVAKQMGDLSKVSSESYSAIINGAKTVTNSIQVMEKIIE
ncbi:MAG TPA: PocR ligand-binding domain-containing protein [Lachnospiraceae bacterium]|nr:PocR ligand-binding domain-containing protein [Lachnospiraceae bacterium]